MISSFNARAERLSSLAVVAVAKKRAIANNTMRREDFIMLSDLGVIRVVGSLIVVVCECMLGLLLRMRCWLRKWWLMMRCRDCRTEEESEEGRFVVCGVYCKAGDTSTL